jgi:hypothetical protein
MEVVVEALARLEIDAIQVLPGSAVVGRALTSYEPICALVLLTRCASIDGTARALAAA